MVHSFLLISVKYLGILQRYIWMYNGRECLLSYADRSIPLSACASLPSDNELRFPIYRIIWFTCILTERVSDFKCIVWTPYPYVNTLQGLTSVTSVLDIPGCTHVTWTSYMVTCFVTIAMATLFSTILAKCSEVTFWNTNMRIYLKWMV